MTVRVNGVFRTGDAVAGLIERMAGEVPSIDTVLLESDSMFTTNVIVEVRDVPSKGPVVQ